LRHRCHPAQHRETLLSGMSVSDRRACGPGTRPASGGAYARIEVAARGVARERYETMGGGQGGSPAGPGPSCVHVAMSNTFNTPLEALESAYPLRVERYALRGRQRRRCPPRGGGGVIRALTALAPCEASILSDRRRHRPRGAAGPKDGAAGSKPPQPAQAGTEGTGRARSRGYDHDPDAWRRLRAAHA
jgi:N-methylhydantoinase B/oxoprolinase/acetone carboxylase alpha subunit